MNKKICKILIIVTVILAIVVEVMYLIDLDKMEKGEPVVFSTWGKKYAPVLKENGVPSTPINNENYQKYSKTIDNTKIELNIPNDWNYEEVPRNEENDFYKYALKIYKNDENQYATLYFYNNKFAVCGTGRTSESLILNNGKEATIGYYDGSENWSDISFYKIQEYIAIVNCGLVDNDAKEVIEFIKTINIVNEQNEYSFCGTITQVEENLIFVEPEENEEIRKSADKIMVGKLKTDANVEFEVGEKVRITYDGYVMEKYPAQIKATKIEKIIDTFNLVFYQKTAIKPKQTETIISKNEVKGVDYNVYAFEGHIAINLNSDNAELTENSISLRDALLQNKITMEEIIEKANKDLSENIITGNMYKDGGSMIYQYSNYTIIKCNTVDGNRDVYIGHKGMTINDLDI